MFFFAFRKGRQASYVLTRYADDILSDTELRWFWISWSHGVISYGRGNQTGLHVLGSYNDSTPTPINYMSISSYRGITGYWIIPRELYHTLGTYWLNYVSAVVASAVMVPSTKS